MTTVAAGTSTETGADPLRVLIAGGGVAALETMMTLRALAADFDARHVTGAFVAPGDAFWPLPLGERYAVPA